MEQTVFRDRLNNKGMSLIEMFIALVIILITSLAMMSTALLGIQTNMANSLRDEAVGVAEAKMNELRNLQFTADGIHASLAATGAGGTAEPSVARMIRASSFTFSVRKTIVDVGTAGDLKQVTIAVTWTFKGQNYTHSITSILKRQEVAS